MQIDAETKAEDEQHACADAPAITRSKRAKNTLGADGSKPTLGKHTARRQQRKLQSAL